MKKHSFSLVLFIFPYMAFAQLLNVPGGAATGIGNSSNSHVGIGTDTPEAMLGVNGEI